MTKETIIAELFFNFRIAKRLLQIDHPACSCGKPSVGVIKAIGAGMKSVVDARCEQHWPTWNDPTSWRVRWNQMEDAKELNDLMESSEVKS